MEGQNAIRGLGKRHSWSRQDDPENERRDVISVNEDIPATILCRPCFKCYKYVCTIPTLSNYLSLGPTLREGGLTAELVKLFVHNAGLLPFHAPRSKCTGPAKSSFAET